MKTFNTKLLTILLFIGLGSSSIFAQNFPTVDAQNEWVVDYLDQIVSFKEIRVYSFAETETLIDGIPYREMVYRTIANPGTIKSTNEFYRQEGNKVYFRHGTDDILLADFELSVGDTLDMNNASFGGSPLVIAARDTINMADGSLRIQLKYYCANDDEPEIPNQGTWGTMSEGLGSFGNMFSQMQSCSLFDPNYFRYTRCFYKAGSLVYKDEEVVDCLISSTSNLQNSTTKVYPNPSFDAITVQSENDIKSLHFINISGRVVQSNTNINKGNVEINELPIGIYMLKITLDNNKLEHVKFVKI
ncbi:MAG TPA: T9SS type A sorting domain-containing protein [Saprospiraceae bacterium]|nr:T9SS type A sorting domain-containing protein [Saprospiraceae bacterium]